MFSISIGPIIQVACVAFIAAYALKHIVFPNNRSKSQQIQQKICDSKLPDCLFAICERYPGTGIGFYLNWFHAHIADNSQLFVRARMSYDADSEMFTVTTYPIGNKHKSHEYTKQDCVAIFVENLKLIDYHDVWRRCDTLIIIDVSLSTKQQVHAALLPYSFRVIGDSNIEIDLIQFTDA